MYIQNIALKLLVGHELFGWRPERPTFNAVGSWWVKLLAVQRVIGMEGPEGPGSHRGTNHGILAYGNWYGSMYIYNI